MSNLIRFVYYHRRRSHRASGAWRRSRGIRLPHTDHDGNMTMLRPGAIFGFRVLESIGDEYEARPVGFRPRELASPS